ncbi:MAG: hypothetical protein IT267_10100, partial [Saprospiraceae bacterium]|nr:hypothetical protein [Saprospiraceae bacterium]
MKNELNSYLYPTKLKSNLSSKSYNTQFLMNMKLNFTIILFSFYIFFNSSENLHAQVNVDPEWREKVKTALKATGESIQFMENKGQIDDPRVLYYFDSKYGSVLVMKNKLVITNYYFKRIVHKFLPDSDENIPTGKHTVSINFEESNPEPILEIGEKFRTKYNYFYGEDSSKWISGARATKELTLKEVYPGIDLRLYSTNNSEVEFDWIVRPHADFSKIKLNIHGQDSLNIASDGSLFIGLRESQINLHIPESYQITPNGKESIKLNFQKSGSLISFKPNQPINSDYPLIIDPTLIWGTLMDGNFTSGAPFDEYLYAIELDTATSILYCGGAANRNLPTTAAPYDADGYLNTITGLNGGMTGLYRAAVLYRISNTGGDLLDLTLFGPSSISNGNLVRIHGLSVAPNRIMVGGNTNTTIPLAGTSFDNTRSGTDGWMASFSKDLGTLHYSTYLGGSGNETNGVISLKALSDSTFIYAMTVPSDLPHANPTYFGAMANDTVYSGGSEMYIGKFAGTSINKLTWGTYIGDSNNETINDIDIATDGRVAFCGWGNGSITQVNPCAAATSNNSTNNNDGIIGVLTANGVTMNYLDEIGGLAAGNPPNQFRDDEIGDIEIYNDTLYWTGDVQTGFPVTAGVYDNSYNGGLSDAVIGKCYAGGTTGYKATFFGGGNTDIGNGIKQVSNASSCGGSGQQFILVWGTTNSNNMPTLNLNNELYFDSNLNGGTDMFFAAFNNNLDTLRYSTYVGGGQNDYLGNVGVPTGANHLYVFGSGIYVGTTTHSGNAGNPITPTTLGGTAPFGGFDLTKDPLCCGDSPGGLNDSHIIFQIGLSSIITTDFGDAPIFMGIPSHKIDCENLYIGNLDSETASQFSQNCDADDIAGIDDEDGVTNLPLLTPGGPQTITVTINNIHNTTGKTAHLYAWINSSDDTRFQIAEGKDTTLANGFVGNVTFAFTNVTVGTLDSLRFLRIRLTTDDMQDDPNTPIWDERAYIAASNGEIEDYLYGVKFLNCPTNKTEVTCKTQGAIDTLYENWLDMAASGGGCNGVLTNNSTGSPSACGGTKTITFTYADGCTPPDTLTCTATFTVANAPALALTCPVNKTDTACQTQAQITAKYNTWLATVSGNGGCSPVITNNSSSPPSNCGEIKTVIFKIKSSCGDSLTCTRTYTVPAPASVNLSCGSSQTEVACQTQANINSKYSTWLNAASFTGGCGGVLTNNSSGNPNACGDSKTITFTVTSNCEAPKTCSKTFIVSAAPTVVLSCPNDTTLTSCQTQSDINNAFDNWKNSATFTGGCNGALSISSGSAPDKCGGSTTVTFTVTSTCQSNVSCTKTFTVTDAPVVVQNCPSNNVQVACQTQSAIDAAFTAWKNSFTSSGGCNRIETNNNPTSPDKCGGVATMTYTVTSDCDSPKLCTRTFTVTTAPTVVLTCPSNKTEAACQTQTAINSAYSSWLATASFTGGCNTNFTNNSTGAPDKCGGTKTVTFTVTSTCTPLSTTCSATFTVTAATAVVLTCPTNKTEDSCLTQTEINNRFNTWLNTASATGGCNNVFTNNNSGAPDKCGGAKTVTFTVTSDCEAPKTCNATYTMPTDSKPGINGMLDTLDVDGGCSIGDVPPAATTVAELEALGIMVFDCTPDASLSVTNTDVGASGACPYNVTRTYTITDACGNTNSAVQILNVFDTVKPTFTKPADFFMNKGANNPDTATLVNYDFNGGTSYSSLCPIEFSGISSEFNSSSNLFKTVAGIASGTLAYATNLDAGKALMVDSSHQSGHWQIDLTGDKLPFCTDFGLYVQAFKNATKSADTLKYQYSLDGSNWTTFKTKPLTASTWIQDTAAVPSNVSNPDSVFFRITYSGGGTGSGNKALYIDNLQIRSSVCCVYEATPNITGDVTDEMDNCAANLSATFCDSTVTEPCEGSTKIYRMWRLEDSCGNIADVQTQLITISDVTKPTFTPPADITLYTGSSNTDTFNLVHYNFNRGISYYHLNPRLFYGISSTVDTIASNSFKTDKGVKTGTLAFYNDSIAGRSLRVDSSNNNKNWTFKISGATLPIVSDLEVYLQTKMRDLGSADTILYQYSLDNVTYNTFKTVALIHNDWKQDTGKIPASIGLDSIFIRFKYLGDTGAYPKVLLIDNFQLRGIVNYDSCAYNASPDITGWPEDILDNCDPYPSLIYEDMLSVGVCATDIIIERTWKVRDDCNNEKVETQMITVLDTMGPQVTCPVNVSVDCGDPTSPDDTGYADGNDGCDTAITITHSDVIIPGDCPADFTINRTWVATDICGHTSTCVQTIEVEGEAPTITCPTNQTEAVCQTQSTINSKFTTWKNTVSFMGGCNPVLVTGSGNAPDKCGGSTTVTFTVNSDCGSVNCNATFTVTNAPAVVITCPTNQTEAVCQTQSDIDSKFTTWKNTASFTGGCNGVISNSGGSAPNRCGGSTNVTFTVTSDCEPVKTCTATFTVTNAPTVVITCPTNQTEAVCQTQSDIDTKFTTWKNTASFTGGCNGVISNSGGSAPNRCGGSTNVTFTVTSDCEPVKTCIATFTVTNAPTVVITCPTNQTEAVCQTQSDIDSKFTTWKNTASFTGGCGGILTNNGSTAPNRCGGSTSVTFTVTSDCEPVKTCNATFTVTNAPAVVITCPANQTESVCQTQAQIDSKFSTWKNTASFTGGCNGVLSNNGSTAPNRCGGSTSVTFTVTSDCEPVKTCNATFTVTNAPAVVITCPTNQTEAVCQTQSDINSKFNTWKNNASFTGGCGGILTNNGTTAPNSCGGSTSVTFTVNSDCESPKTCTATFTVTNAPAVVLTCPTNQTESACQTQAQIDSKFSTWKNTASFSGGCGGMLTNNGSSAPTACGGSINVIFTVTSNCEPQVNCTSTFTVTNAPTIVLTCPNNVVEAACQSQTDINTKYNNWINTASFTGGCNGVLTNNSSGPPTKCGDTKNVTFTVSSDCEALVICSASFAVITAPSVSISCPNNTTETSCQSQTDINTKFNTWKNTASFTGGCNGVLTNSGGTAPNRCGGSETVTFTVTSDCEPIVNCSATFTVDNAPAVNLNCPLNIIESICQSQADINTKFNNWKNTASYTGGCGGVLTNSGGVAPNHCGGSTTVTFTVSSDCEAPKTCSATYEVSPAPSVSLTCPTNATEAACQSQTDINNKFNTWKNTASFTGGCNGNLTNSGGTAPDKCGGATTVTFTVTSDCENPVTCNSTFTVTNAPAVVITCPSNQTEPACQTQADIDSKFNTWKNTASFSGGCNPLFTNSNGSAPNRCGGATSVTFTVNSDCESPKTCTATFTVTNAPAVVLNCPANQTEPACQTQADIDSKFSTWKNTASFSGGCNPLFTNSNGSAPNRCGGTTSVTFTVNSDCESPKTCTATFTVTNAPAVVITCPVNQTESACQTQADIDSKFNTWKNTASFSGGCGGVLTISNVSAPNHCGGTATVTFTVNSDCEAPKTCTANFTVNPAPAVVLTCPTNQTESACQTQAQIDSKFSTWKNTASFTG